MSLLHAPLHRWTVAEYEELARSGFFGRNKRIELLHGQIIHMSPIGLRHLTAVNRLNKFFIRKSRDRYDVSPQNSFNLDEHSQPQPDLALIDCACDAPPRRAQPVDVFLVIEVADSSVTYDREDKGPAYAAEGIREFWLLNLDTNCLEIYRDPQPGGYAHEQVLGPDEKVSPLAFPDLVLRVGDFLP
jgi:Uma2 family endonuclease